MWYFIWPKTIVALYETNDHGSSISKLFVLWLRLSILYFNQKNFNLKTNNHENKNFIAVSARLGRDSFGARN